jgi:hypothetical protein
MEILSEFSSVDDEDESVETPLIRFKDWYNSGQDTTDFQKKFVRSLDYQQQCLLILYIIEKRTQRFGNTS